ncbi:MAG: hypothetical protein GF392_00395, partial [Candidatus Omnitrophica bacterium]|nr:hypothetical protein [Candidatus Omnitrophota bacterium]
MFTFNPRRSLFCRIISVALVFAFSFYNVSFAVETPIKAPEVSEMRKPLSIDDIGIAIDAATVKSRYQGDSGKVIVHIQDAHCNFEAQSNITKVLGQVTSECGIDMISVEGAEGLVDTAWFRAFPDAEIREEVATYFMKKGEITGAEFFSITSDFTGSIFGAETREYYVKNLRAFTDVYPYKTSIEKYFTELGSVSTRLKDLVYSKQLRQLDSRMNAFADKDLDLSEYAEYLSSLASRKKVDVEQYPNFNKLLETLKYEDKIDFDIVDSERSEYIDLLSKKLSKENMTELVAQSIRFKKGHVKAVDFYGYLRELAREHDIKIVREYPNLFYYYLYTKLYDGIDNEQLFRELGRVETALKERLFTSPTERTLDKYSHMVDMYVDLVNIELTNEDYDLFNRYHGEFSMDDVLTFMSGLVSRYNLNYELSSMPDRIANNLPRMINFYEIAIKRDNALIENTLDQMDRQGTDRCVLIAGGFHTRGIKDLLEKKGISYMVVTPKITKDVETPYIKVLTNQRTSLEDIITESAAVPSVGITASREEIVRPKGDMLNAPERVFWTIPLYLENPDDPKELKALSRAMGIADGRSLLEATEYTYEEMVSALVRGWIVKVRNRATPEVWEKAVQDWPLLMGAYLAKYEEAAAEAGVKVREGLSAPEEGRRLTDEEIEQVDAQFRKIFQDIVVEETTPGHQAITAADMALDQDDIGTPLTDEQHKALNKHIIKPLIEAGAYEIETIDGAEVYQLRGLEERVIAYNALADEQDRLPVNIVHPGRGKDHDGANIYLSAGFFEKGPNALNDAEIRALI